MEILKLTETTSYIRLIDNQMWLEYEGEILAVVSFPMEAYFGANSYTGLNYI